MNKRTRRADNTLTATAALVILACLTGCATSPAGGAVTKRAATATPTTEADNCDFIATRESTHRANTQNTALFYVELTNANAQSTDCEISGFPDVALIDSTGQVVGDPASKRSDIPDTKITVTTNNSAYVLIKVARQKLYPNCPLLGAESLRIRLPHGSEDVLIDVTDLAICDPATSGWLVYNIAPTPANPLS